MTQSFKLAIRNKKIKSPNERSFDLKLWDKKWSECGSPMEDKEECDIYLGGRVIDSLLNEIRSTLVDLYKRRPASSKKALIQSHVAFSNRNRAIIARPNIDDITTMDLHSLSTNKNPFGIEITYQELAEQSVDSIKSALLGILTGSHPVATSTSDDMDLLEFVQTENALSGLYRTYEDYWSALLWGAYELNVINADNKIYEIKQKPSDLIYEITQARKMKLDEHSDSFLFRMDLDAIDYTDLNYMKITGSGRTRKIKTDNLSKASHKLKFISSSIRHMIAKIERHYPSDFFNHEFKRHEFTVKDVLNVFSHLIIFSEAIMDRFPPDDSVFNVKKLSEFCPTFKVQELVLNIAKSTKISSTKVYNIVDFLTYKGEGNSDLWCHPIIEVDNNEVVILVSALNGSVIQRVAEHWFVSFGMDLTEKGTTYENLVIDSIARSVQRNPILNDYDIPISKRIKLVSGEEEEIDFLMRLGNKIIVGESKSIVTTDSSISHFRTIGVIAGAKDQVLRKTDFFRRNMEEVFSKISWNYELSKTYELIPLIFVSNKIHSGFPYENIFVTDEILLAKYFSGEDVPLLSDINSKSIAWFDLYETEGEAIDNLELYLSAPPQITKSYDDYGYKSMNIPCISDESTKIMFTRLVLKDASPADLVNRKFSFRLNTSDDFDEIVSKMDFLI